MAGRRRAKRGRKTGWGLAAWLPGGILVLACLGIASAAISVRLIEAELPQVPSFDEYAASVPKVSRVVAKNGDVVAEFFTERRTIMFPDRLPTLLEKAVLAAEDATFFEHSGLSYMGILRAMVVNTWKGRVSQGGSTITQQVVKQVLLSPERTYQRKIRELLLARLVEAKLQKSEILAIYMSAIYLGHGRYGFEEAARYLFGRRATDLSLAEAAMLAGLVSAPERNSPLRNPGGAVLRQRYVLRQMVQAGWITTEEEQEAVSTRLELWAQEAPRLGAAPYFVDAVRREATSLFGWGRLLHDGLTVRTSLDLDVSDAAEAAVAHGLGNLWAAGRTRMADEAALGTGRQDDDDAGDDIPPPPESVPARVVTCGDSQGRISVDVAGRSAWLEPRSLGRMVLGGEADPYGWCRGRHPQILVSRFSEARAGGDGGDDTPAVVNAELGPQAALVVLDPATRGVAALVGGEDHAARPFNRAVQSRRPIGSTVKPFLYAAALEAGVGLGDMFPNERICFRGAKGRPWCPRNFEGGYDGREYSVADALVKSMNVIAIRVARQIGVGPVADLLRELGVDGGIPRDLSLALGSAESSPLALANAFATFAVGGNYDTPYLIEEVLDHRRKSLLVHEARPSRRIGTAVANGLKTTMRRAVEEGTGRLAADLPVQAWGKTGTSNRSREAWFVGSDGRHVVSVLVGYDDRHSMPGATGGNTAVPFFNLFVRMSQRR